MAANDPAASRISSLTSASARTSTSTSTDSTRSSAATSKPTISTTTNSTVPPPTTSRRPIPARINTDDMYHSHIRGVSHIEEDDDLQISPTTSTATTRGALSPPPPPSASSNATSRDRRMSDLTNYRRDLAILDAPRGQSISGGPGLAATQIAPWMSSSTIAPSTSYSMGFHNDSSESLAFGAQLSPGLPPGSRGGNGVQDSPETYYDGRRPSAASINTTASSTGSKASIRGGFRKLQGFFGEDFPGRDSSESSLPTSVVGKEQRSRSYSNTRPTQSHHRDRNFSNATDHTRDVSPASSRPRTPVPAPEVVPFLYQDNNDIARYGEAPVRDIMTGPDRERYISSDGPSQSSVPPKSSSSGRSGMVHLPHHHRHNKSNDDPRTLRPSASREDSISSSYPRERGMSAAIFSSKSRAQSPTPSTHSGAALLGRSGNTDGTASPGHHGRLGILGRLRRHKDKDDSGGSSRLRELPQSTRSLQSKPSKIELPREVLSPSAFPSGWPGPPEPCETPEPPPPPPPPRAGAARTATFNNKFPFAKKGRGPRQYDYVDETIGPTDRTIIPRAPAHTGQLYHLDTNLNDMEGILAKPPPLTPMDTSFVNATATTAAATTAAPAAAAVEPESLDSAVSAPKGGWNAPDSWAVRRNTEDNTEQTPEMDMVGSPPRPEEKMTPYFIRIFRSDGTFSTHSMALDSSVTDVISQVIKKTYISEGMENYNIIMKKHDLIRVLQPGERPLFIQKRLLQQIGYEEADRIEELGREDNGYLCRFMFLSARESDFHSRTTDLGLSRTANQKASQVDLSGRNLITIPISLYSKATEISELNLSRNLSLDVPRDFIQSCKSLRAIRYNNNEARKLPPSLSRAIKLDHLDVSNNRLEQLEHVELNLLVSLAKMNLSNNRLIHLPPYFGAYETLRTLNISSNFLDQFPVFLCELTSLTELDLSFNAIAELPAEIGKLKNLKSFHITNNRLTNSLPDTFQNLTGLQHLDIKYNSITSIDVISELPNLEILSAAHNSISAFVGKFARLSQLKLNSNPLNKFEIVQPVPTLKILNLSHAQLSSIELVFSNLQYLEHLNLDHNFVVSLPQQISTMSRLEKFSIANNLISELPPQIGSLSELKVLDIRGNNISKLPEEIWSANKLETLNASSNVLEIFPKPPQPAQPTTKPPRNTGEEQPGPPPVQNGKQLTTLSSTASSEELVDDRRPSQASSNLLSVGPSPILQGVDRKNSLVSVYGKGGRKSSVISGGPSRGTGSAGIGLSSGSRKDSGQSVRYHNTFAGSLRYLYLADNRLDDDIFEAITLLPDLRILNLSYNDEIADMPQRSIKSWPQLVELYLSGNALTSLPADDLEESSLLQSLYINGNRFTNLPADMSRAKKLAVLDCGNNTLKYNISNVPYDWNWNLNPNLRYLNLSGNKRLEIKQTSWGGPDGPGAVNREEYTDFSRLANLRILGLMDVTLTQPSIPDQSEDRRVRTSGSLAGHLPYGMADTLGKNEHLSTVDLVVPRFNASETETLLGLFDGQELSSGGSKIAKYLHENFGHIFAMELKALKSQSETPADALRRTFLALNKDLVTIAAQFTESRSKKVHRGSAQPVILSREDLNSGGVATVLYLQGPELYVANVGNVQAMLIQGEGKHQILTRNHDPAEPSERSRIREAGGWVSRNGKLNEMLRVSRAFGYVDLMPAVQAAPHVAHLTVKEGEDIILMATSELWEYLSPGLVADIARAERQDLMRASQKLRDLAMAYGATGKIMVMMIAASDLKKKMNQSRLSRGTSMYGGPSTVPDEAQVFYPRRGRKAKGDILDSSLNKIRAEITAPIGTVAIVFTDIKNSTNLWEMYPNAMRSAIKLHNEVMRRQLRSIGGYEVKTEGDAFMVSFPTATSALLWCFTVQVLLLEVAWPSEILNSMSGHAVYDKDDILIFKGLSVRMGIHYGDCVSETDPVTRRMDYFGPMVNKASRISSVADGGQITVSSDFISEIQRWLENMQEIDRNGSAESDEALEYDIYAASIRDNLKSLTNQGFGVKEMGERKLKGLENPEVIYSLYPQVLAGRVEYQQTDRPPESANQPAAGITNNELSFDPESIWSLWKVSLRLEMLCSSLEEARGTVLQPPETDLLERMKGRPGEVTERFLISFLGHQVSRIETCVSTLAMRHIAMGGGILRELNELRAPMAAIFAHFTQQQEELERYKKRYGELDDTNSIRSTIVDESTEDEGSDTEQE
ncbi:Adenylate cyclase [Cladobotryum mycophilum]|uniref:Adenylate cyclase n=1 Tax=Cladobotryum mycophilum TaxID=491253 RepID=A0ABR0S5Y6_9HYPO